MEQPTQLTCTRCHEPRDADDFYVRNGKRRGTCKPCVRDQSRASFERNKEARKASLREYRERNREALAAKARADYQANRERRNAQSAAWQLANPEKAREANRRSYRKNRERRISAIAAYRAANPEWDAARNRTQAARRRARERGVLVIAFTDQQLAARIAYYGGMCWICRAVPYEEVDHVKPIKHGGPHILANLRPACRSCNASKNGQWPFHTARRVPVDRMTDG